MSEVFAALAPVFLLIGLGALVRQAHWATPETFFALNRFGYFVLLPAFLFTVVTHADFGNAEALKLVLAVLVGYALMALACLAARPLFAAQGARFTSFFQGAVRWNAFPLLAAAPALYGPQGAQLVALVYGPLVFMINLLCVPVLARWGERPKAGGRAIVDQIVANPLILACAAALGAQALGVKGFGPLGETLRLLGQAAMPVALITVGAGLDFAALRSDGAIVAATAAMRLLAMPAMMWGLCSAFALSAPLAAIAIGIAATPTAAAAYTLAREMGGDERLMAAIITATTLLSFVTMPLAIALALR